jgi:hypothetical protein
MFVTGMTVLNAFGSESKLSKLGVSTALGNETTGDDVQNHEEDSIEKEENKADEKKPKEANSNNSNEVDEVDYEESDNEVEVKDVNKVKKVETEKNINSKQGVENEEDEADTEEGDLKENEEAEDVSDLQEDVQDLNKEIRKVESRIGVLSSNGFVVTAFTPVLAEVKDLASQAQALIATNPIEAKIIIETADKKLEKLNKLVKMTLGDDDNEVDDDNDALEKIQELTKDIKKLELNLEIIAGGGADVSTQKLALGDIKTLLAQANEKLTVADFVNAEAIAEVADKKLEVLEHAIELAFGDDIDDIDEDEAVEYKNNVASFVHNLDVISEMDNGIGQQVKVVAQAQRDSQPKVENSINTINARNGFMKFLVGPKYGSIAEIKTAITENQARITVLTNAMNQITDPAVKIVMQDQIKLLAQENVNLQAFTEKSENGISLFGWLVKIFS